MLLSEPFPQQVIAHRAGKRNVKGPAGMNMPDLCVAKAEFFASEAVKVNRDLFPGGNLRLELLQVLRSVFWSRSRPHRTPLNRSCQGGKSGCGSRGTASNESGYARVFFGSVFAN
jgi:hypothetical protein